MTTKVSGAGVEYLREKGQWTMEDLNLRTSFKSCSLPPEMNSSAERIATIRAFYETGIPDVNLARLQSKRKTGNLFISGLPRSGTTAFKKLLNLVPDIALYDEQTDWGAPIHPRDLDPDNVMSQLLKNTARVPKKKFFVNFANAVKACRGARWIGDKRPLFFNASLNQTIENFHGRELRVIHIFRPIREIVASYERKANASRDSWPNRRNGNFAISEFNITNLFLSKTNFTSNDNIRFVNYEEVFLNEVQLDDILRWLGIETQTKETMRLARAFMRESAQLINQNRKSAEAHTDPESYKVKVNLEAARRVEAMYGAKFFN